MIIVIDDFLDPYLLKGLQADTDPFNKVDVHDATFWVKRPSPQFMDYVCSSICRAENRVISPILGFFREAKKEQDNTWRIHNDAIVEGKTPERAAVLYISEEIEGMGLNGTAFWEHKERGDSFDGGMDSEDYNNVLAECDDKSKWTLKSVIGHKANRLLLYPANYFHSKYPNEFEESRVVFALFYSYADQT